MPFVMTVIPGKPIRPRQRRVNRIPFVKTDGGKNAAGFFSETRDCTVRSLAIAADISYQEAHAICAAAGRGNRMGLSDYGVKRAATKAAQQFNLIVTEIPCPKGVNSGRDLIHGTFAQMRLRYTKGRYIFTSGRHAFAVIDGVLHDSWHVGGRTHVGMILRIDPIVAPKVEPQITQPQINELWARLERLEAR